LAVKTFTGDRPFNPVTDGKFLRSWHLSASATAVVEFCNGSAGAPMFQVQLPAGSSASQAYHKPLCFPLGLHVELVSGTLVRGAIDLDR
jgi:hypothetical protein